jgi:hypothetical protein
MKKLSVEQQIALLRPTMGFAAQMHKWFLAGAALGVIASVIFWNPIPLIVSIFVAIVGFSEKRAGPNIVIAISAYDSETPSLGEVSITITCWDTDNHYHATLREQGHSDWQYEFVPQGWQPTTGTCPARIWRAGVKRRPVLAVVEEGIMIPRYDPKPVLEQAGNSTSA